LSLHTFSGGPNIAVGIRVRIGRSSGANSRYSPSTKIRSVFFSDGSAVRS
jgi:hypothetical protein